MPVYVKGTNTTLFIDKADIPAYQWKDVTYDHIIISYTHEKSDSNCTRLKVGGNRVDYPGDCRTPTTDLLAVKLLLNSTISILGERFMTLDIKYFYLMTPMEQYKYMQLKLDNIPKDVIKQYNLKERFTKDSYVYLKIRQEMYELPQAGILAQKQL